MNPQIAQMLLAMAQRGGPGRPGITPPHPGLTNLQPPMPRPQVFDLRPQAQPPPQQPQGFMDKLGGRGNIGSLLQNTGMAMMAQSDQPGSTVLGNLGRSLPHGLAAVDARKQSAAIDEMIDGLDLPDSMKSMLRGMPAAQAYQAAFEMLTAPGEESKVVAEGAAVVKDGEEIYKNVREEEDEGLRSEGERYALDRMRARTKDTEWSKEEATPEQLAEFAAFQERFRQAGVPGTADLVGAEMVRYYTSVAQEDMDGVRKSIELEVPMREMLTLLGDPDLPSGALAGAELRLGQIVESMGGTLPGTAEGEVFRALSNVMAINKRNPAGGAGLPGQMSDKDVQFLRDMVPKLENTRDGNIRLLEYNLAVMDGINRVRQARIDYFNRNRTLDGFDSKRWANENIHATAGFSRSESASDGLYNKYIR